MKTFRLLNSRRTLAAALVALPLLALAGCNQSQSGDSSAPATTGAATTATNAAPSTPAAASDAAGAAFALEGSQKRDVTPGDLAAAEKTRTAGVVSRDKKTLTFSAPTIRLVVRTGPDDDMLSYRIQGLRNPTLIVPAGATLKVLFASTDYHGEAAASDGHEGHDHGGQEGHGKAMESPAMESHEMRHDLRFGDRRPPFSATPGLDGTVGSARLMAMEKDRFPAEELTLRAPAAGDYTYFCSVSGHAQGGMWGKVQVTAR